MSTELNDYQLGPIFLVSLVVILAATEVGRWLGFRAGDQGGDEVLTLQGACLGLLALMIAFTFASPWHCRDLKAGAMRCCRKRMPFARQRCVRACCRNRTTRKR
jgi:hypothetical protein